MKRLFILLPLLTPLVLISGCSTTPCEHWAVPHQLRATLEPEEVEKHRAVYNNPWFRILAGIALSNAQACCPPKY